MRTVKQHQEHAQALTDIRAKIANALETAGLGASIRSTPNRMTDYDDSTALVVVSPEANWEPGICRVVVYADRVARWNKRAPFAHTSGVITEEERYSTVERMVELVLQKVFVRRSPAWDVKKGTPQ